MRNVRQRCGVNATMLSDPVAQLKEYQAVIFGEIVCQVFLVAIKQGLFIPNIITNCYVDSLVRCCANLADLALCDGVGQAFGVCVTNRNLRIADRYLMPFDLVDLAHSHDI